MKLNLTDKLQQEKPVLEIAGHEFEVDNSKNAVLAFEQENHTGKKHIEIIEETIRHFMGEHALSEIQKLDLSYRDYDRIFIAVMSLATEESYEDTERRFQQSARTDKLVL